MFEKVVGITPDFPLASEHLLKVRRSRPPYGAIGAGRQHAAKKARLAYSERLTTSRPIESPAVCFALRSFGRSAARTNPYPNGGFDLLCNGIGSGGRTALAEQRPYRWHC